MTTYTPIATAGWKLYISATPGGSPTNEIFGVDQFDKIETERKVIDRTTLRDTTRQRGLSGIQDGKQVRLQFRRSNQDAGQQLLKAAHDAGVAYNFKATANDAAALSLTNPTTYTWSALVSSFGAGPATTVDDDIMGEAVLEITGVPTETLPS